MVRAKERQTDLEKRVAIWRVGALRWPTITTRIAAVRLATTLWPSSPLRTRSQPDKTTASTRKPIKGPQRQ